MSNAKIKCESCGHKIMVNINEVVDVSDMPQFKQKILDGRFFLVKCSECGAETLVEYPFIYVDPDKKLNIYMTPEDEDEVLKELNSLELPEDAVDKEAVFRLVENSGELIEKIMINNNGRDDRIIELYKVVLAERIREDWPQISAEDLVYFADDKECFIIWNSDCTIESEQLTVLLDDRIYDDLSGYADALSIPAGKYAHVNNNWIVERVYTGD